MRKLAIGSLAALFAVSVPALAQARTHHATHQRHVHHSRIVHLRPASKSSTIGSPSESPGNPQGETAGTVASFEGGVLTVTLNGGSKVSGMVTEQTEIHCEGGPPMAHAADHGSDGGDNSSNGGSDNSPGEGGNHGESGHDQQSGDDNGQGDDDQGDQEENQPQCGIGSLVPGALVREAELRLSSSGAVFKEIELVG